MRVRAYDHATDFDAVGRMLIESYPPGPAYEPWLQPRWEYANFHPLIRGIDRSRSGVAEHRGRLLGLVNIEHDPAVCYLSRRPGADEVIKPLLDWAEQHIGGWSDTFGGHVLCVSAPPRDVALRDALAGRGFTEHVDGGEALALLDDLSGVEPPPPPAGYRIQSLADDNDLAAVHAVLWHGFDHDGPPPPDGIDDRRFMQSAPNFRPDLTIVAVAPDGSYASFCGMWVVPENRAAMVEPVATHPDHRRRGLGRVVVLESLRRARAAGAEVAWVGSEQLFYRSLGFEISHTCSVWVRSRP